MSASHYMRAAQESRIEIIRVLQSRGLTPPVRWLLTETQNAWLIGILPQLPSLAPYFTQDLIHTLSTNLHGRRVIVSNSTGLRYAILLSPIPTLPARADYPELPGKDLFPFGIGYQGPVALSANDWQHMLIGGASGSGKSTFLRGIVHTARRFGWQLYLVDPDGNTFNPDQWSSAAARPVAQSPKDLMETLGALLSELERRRALYAEAARANKNIPPRDLDEYNQAASLPLQRIALVIDEANSYLGDKNVVSELADLARRGRKWGMHLVLAAHNWRANDVPRELSSMLRTRVCFQVVDNTSGEVVLGSRRWGKAAMRFRLPGRAVVMVMDKTRILQTYQVPELQELTWLGQSPSTQRALSEVEAELVRYAVEQLNGEFILDKLAAAFVGKVSRWKVRTLAEAWEQRGWLTQPADAVSARKVTPELMKLANFGP